MQTPSPQNRRLSRAFSLVEVIVVLAIVGTLGAIAVPRYGFAIERYRSIAAYDRVVADLTNVQRKARATGTIWTVVFDNPGTRYNVYNAPATEVSDSLPVSTVVLGADPYNATITLADIDGRDYIEFDMYGQPTASGAVYLKSGRIEQIVSVGQ